MLAYTRANMLVFKSYFVLKHVHCMCTCKCTNTKCLITCNSLSIALKVSLGVPKGVFSLAKRQY